MRVETPPKPKSQARLGAPMPPRGPLMLVAAVGTGLLLLALAPQALAHGPGAEALHATGSVDLDAAGGTNASVLLAFQSMGLPVDAGDVLLIDWEVTGDDGTSVTFEVQEHGPEADVVVLYQATGPSHQGSLVIPGPGRYMAFWENPNDVAVEVAYSLELEPPAGPSGIPLQDYIPVALLAAAAVLFGVLVWRGRRSREEEGPEE